MKTRGGSSSVTSQKFSSVHVPGTGKWLMFEVLLSIAEFGSVMKTRGVVTRQMSSVSGTNKPCLITF